MNVEETRSVSDGTPATPSSSPSPSPSPTPPASSLPTSPKVFQRDRLCSDLLKSTRSPRATQLLPNYGEFRLGHGDPLIRASLQNITTLAKKATLLSSSSSFSKLSSSLVGEAAGGSSRKVPPPCTLKKSPSSPNLCFVGDESENGNDADDDDDSSHEDHRHHRHRPVLRPLEDVDMLLKGQQGSPLCFGINDIVHMDNNVIMSFPCLPVDTDDTQWKNGEEDAVEEETMIEWLLK